VLTAKREGGDVTAGVRVFGTLRNPKLTFFSDSDPGMTQSEITNYLVTGIPPGGAGAGGNQDLSLGTYVAPKLFMEYESSLGDEQDKVKLRYDFNEWMEFQTETGESQGADVFFKLER
jgi:translocation and assembly module TamB